MATTREDKVAVVGELKETMARAKIIVLTEYRGLSVASMTDLRRRIRGAGGHLKVAKNTLARRAAHEAGIEGLDPMLSGPIALAFGFDDPAAVPKVLTQFQKEFGKVSPVEITGGVIEGRVVAMDEIKRVADLPSREVLLAQVVGGLQAPLTGLVNVLQGNIRKFVYALEAVRKLKEA
ncbi:MAG: 50S ribosomal protein L10 [Thermoanaerobacterales bacterium]|nr:50S ribosomal protein L10 [Bacillota bacterium]MDI6907843.1 50S ribosomal protein L10 [Thermoanaerobacterales bacterium]